jgi:hypothetical protein
MLSFRLLVPLWLLSVHYLVSRLSQYVHKKHRQTSTRLYRVTSQAIVFSSSRVPQVQRNNLKVLNIFTLRSQFQFHSETRGTPLGICEIFKLSQSVSRIAYFQGYVIVLC